MAESFPVEKMFFTGRSEKFLLEKLKKEKTLRFDDVFSLYRNGAIARTFIKKIVFLKVAVISEPNKLKYVEPKEGK